MKINICDCAFEDKEIEEINIHKLEVSISFKDNTFNLYSRNKKGIL